MWKRTLALIGSLLIGLMLPSLTLAQTQSAPAIDPDLTPGQLDAWEIWFEPVSVWGPYAQLGGLALDAATGFIYVCESGAARIRILDSQGRHAGGWGSIGDEPGQFQHPTDLAIGPNDRVYVLDQGHQRVQVYTNGGRYIGQFDAPHPVEIDLDAAGRAYVLNRAGRIWVYEADGAMVGQLALEDELGRAIAADHMAVHPGGTLYVTDPLRYRMVVFDLTGAYLYQWPSHGERITALGLSPDGLCYTAEPSSGVHVHTLHGLELGSIPLSAAHHIAATHGNPARLLIAADNQLYLYHQTIEQNGPRTALPLCLRAAADPTPIVWTDTHEPNDDFAHAAGPLLPGQTVQSYIWSREDQDYYFFDLPTLDPVLIQLIGGPATADFDLYLYDGQQQRVAKSERLGTDEEIVHLPTQLGTHYILVRPYDPTGGRYTPYELVAYFQHDPLMPTPTATDWPYPLPATATRTATPSATPSATPTATTTPSPTKTPSATSTATPSPTMTATIWDTPTHAPSPTMTASLTKTATVSPSSTATDTATHTATIGRTATHPSSPTPTVSATATRTVIWTETPLPPPPTYTPTYTSTPSWTPSSTPTTPPTATPPALHGRDLGDAPTSYNGFGALMYAYPNVLAQFPTVYGGHATEASAAVGPLHHNEITLFHLGQRLTAEWDADKGLDQDGPNNIHPKAGLADQDGGDDGLLLPQRFTHCRSHRLNYTVRVLDGAPAKAYVNIWIDWDRNGRWGDEPVCTGWRVSEWAVQNQVVKLEGIGLHTYSTPAFMAYNKEPLTGMWVRITISESPATRADGGGPAAGYGWGETEDYYLPGASPVTPTPTPRR